MHRGPLPVYLLSVFNHLNFFSLLKRLYLDRDLRISGHIPLRGILNKMLGNWLNFLSESLCLEAIYSIDDTVLSVSFALASWACTLFFLFLFLGGFSNSDKMSYKWPRPWSTMDHTRIEQYDYPPVSSFGACVLQLISYGPIGLTGR